jgi:hypothetical protein
MSAPLHPSAVPRAGSVYVHAHDRTTDIQGATAMSELASESWAQRLGRMPATSASEELV